MDASFLAARRASTLSHEQEAEERRLRTEHEAELMESALAVSASLNEAQEQQGERDNDMQRMQWAQALSISEFETAMAERLAALELLMRDAQARGDIPTIRASSLKTRVRMEEDPAADSETLAGVAWGLVDMNAHDTQCVLMMRYGCS